MAFRGTRGGPSTSTTHDGSYLERHNDSLVDELSTKVAALKKVTISIGEDVREQNRLLNSMDDDFDASKGLLSSTMRRLGIVSKAGGRFIVSLHFFYDSYELLMSLGSCMSYKFDKQESDVLFDVVRSIRLLRYLLFGKVEANKDKAQMSGDHP
ncbi:SNARE domain protein [Cooperia oncophora]